MTLYVAVHLRLPILEGFFFLYLTHGEGGLVVACCVLEAAHLTVVSTVRILYFSDTCRRQIHSSTFSIPTSDCSIELYDFSERKKKEESFAILSQPYWTTV
jgi:hypothetical protein